MCQKKFQGEGVYSCCLVRSNFYYQVCSCHSFVTFELNVVFWLRINHLSSQKTTVGRFVVVLRLHFSVCDLCTTELVVGLLVFLRYAQPVSTYNLLGY